MGVTFGTNSAVITVYPGGWTLFKSYVQTKNLQVQYVYDAGQNSYTVFALENAGSVVYTAIIWSGSVPDSVTSQGYTQSQNDTDKADFEGNFKSTANAPIYSNVTGSVVSTTSGSIGLTGPVTGSVGITAPVTVYQHAVTISGSVPLIVTGSDTLVSGSVTGLLMGGVALSQQNPMPITGTVGLTGPITGSVGIAGPVAVANFPATQTVTGSVGLTGPVTGTVGLSGPVAVSNFPATQNITGSAWTPTITGSMIVTNQVNVTGSVGLAGPVAISNFPSGFNVNVTGSVPLTVLQHAVTISGSVPLIVTASITFPAVQTITGSVNLTSGITGSVGLTGPITGSVGLSGPVAVSNFPATQTVTGSVGLAGPVAVSNFPASQTVTGSVGLTSGITGSVGLSGPITGTVGLSGPVAVSNFPGTQIISGSAWTPTVTGSVVVANTVNTINQSGSVTGLLVGGVALSFANPLPITGSIAITPVAVQNVTGSAWTPTITGSIGLSGPVTGSVGITGPVAISNFPATQTVTGSVGLTGPITGSVTLAAAPQVNQGTSPWIISGSNWTQTITGSVVVANQVNVTGSIGLTGPITGSVTLASAPTVNQGTSPWIISGSGWTPTVTGSVIVANTVNVIHQSGSVTGLLVGGVALSNANPLPITGSIALTPVAVQNVTGSAWTPTVTGSVGLSGPITGTVSIASSVAVNNFPATQTVTGSVGLSGPITGTVGLSGPVAVSNFPATQIISGSAWTPTVTGSVIVSNTVNVIHQSGSVTGLLVGGVVVSNVNPVPVTGSVGLTGPITGSVVLAAAPTVNQGTSPWIVSGSGWTPTVTGSVVVTNVINVGGYDTGSLSHPFAVDTAGRQIVVGMSAVTGTSTVNWINTTTVDSNLTIPTTGYNSVIVFISSSNGTLTGGGMYPEVSTNGSTWSSASFIQLKDLTDKVTYLFNNNYIPNDALMFNCAGFSNARVRLNPAISGLATASVNLLATSANTPVPNFNLSRIVVVNSSSITNIGPNNTQGPFFGFDEKEVNLCINVLGPINGTLGPKLTVRLNELDPGDLSTIRQQVTASITATGIYTLTLLVASDVVNVTWGLAGTNPSFGGTYMTLEGKEVPSVLPVAMTDGLKATYSACINGMVPSTGASDIFTLTGGSGKTIRLNRIGISGNQTISQGVTFLVVKRTTANTAGVTFSLPTPVPHDINNPAVVGSARVYSSNPVTGTLAGILRAGRIYVGSSGTFTDPYEWTFGTRANQAVVLRNGNDVVAVNLNGATVTGGSLNIDFDWTEE